MPALTLGSKCTITRETSPQKQFFVQVTSMFRPFHFDKKAYLISSLINAEFGLYSEEESGASYTITSTTSNGRLDVRVNEQPLNSRLRLDAESSNSPASVTLPPTFEGKFYLKSSIFTPKVDVSRVEDPSGEGRERDVNVGRINGGVAKGYARWANGGERNGEVELRTSNSPAYLRL